MSGLVFLSNIFVGVLSGIIGAVIYRIMSYNAKPIMEICGYIIKSFNSKNTPVLRVKIINKNKTELADVKVKLYGINYNDAQKRHQIRTFIAKRELDFIPKFNKKDKQCNYVYQTALKSQNIHKEIEQFKELLLVVKAIDYYNNTIGIIEKKFHTEDLKDYKWQFVDCECNATKRDDIKEIIYQENNYSEIIKNCPFIKKEK